MTALHEFDAEDVLGIGSNLRMQDFQAVIVDLRKQELAQLELHPESCTACPWHDNELQIGGMTEQSVRTFAAAGFSVSDGLPS